MSAFNNYTCQCTVQTQEEINNDLVCHKVENEGKNYFKKKYKKTQKNRSKHQFYFTQNLIFYVLLQIRSPWLCECKQK